MTSETRISVLIGLVLIITFGLIVSELTGRGSSGPATVHRRDDPEARDTDVEGHPAPARQRRRPAPAPQPMRLHVVRHGDTLVGIATLYWGRASAGKYEQIYEANRHQLADPRRLPVGMRLVIPSPR